MPSEINARFLASPMDAIIRVRRRLAWVMLIDFGLLACNDLVERCNGAEHSLPKAVDDLLVFTGSLSIVLGLVFWYFVLKSAQLSKQHPATAKRLNDELFRENQTKAALSAFLVIFAIQSVIFLAGKSHPFRADIDASISIYAAIETLLGVSLYLDRDL